MRARPDDSCLLSTLPLAPLSEHAADVIRRSYAFLAGITRPQLQVPALLGGYTDEVHTHGGYLLRCATGHRTFGEWREWRVLRPPRDPDMPSHVAELGAFVSKWVAIARGLAAECTDEDDRAEIEELFDPRASSRPTVWQARVLASLLQTVKTEPWIVGQSIASKLRALDVLRDVARARSLVEEVQAHLRAAPLEDDELQAIAEEREAMAEHLRAWLDERRAALQSLSKADLDALGLGEHAPNGPPSAARELRPFVVHAKA